MTLKRIEPVSCARISGVIYAGLGLLFGMLISVFALIGTALSGTPPGLAQNTISPLIGGAVGIGAILICPVLYGVMGFVLAWIGAWFYNLVASKVGGFEIEVA